MEKKMKSRHVVFALIGLAALSACSGANKSQSTAAASPAATAAAPAAATVAPAAAATATPAPDPLAAAQFTDINGIFAEKAIREEAVLGVFNKTSGPFNPYGTLTRADYVRWLVLANNAIFKNAPSSQIRLAEPDSDQTFVDVPKSNPNFKYIQGMVNSGFVIGINKNHFAPDRPLTREEMIAILNSRYMNGSKNPVADAPPTQYLNDGNQVSKPYWGLIDYDFSQPGYNPGFGNINRIFGTTKTLHPLKPATRAEAAIAIQRISNGDAGTTLGVQ
jgi:hypothetical protein